MHTRNDDQFFVAWINEEMKKETLAAKKAGETFPPEINVYDQFKSE